MFSWQLESNTYLSLGVSSVPQSIPKVFAWSCGWVHYFNGQSRVTLCFSGCMRPVGLCDLFPHHHIETCAGLVAKHKAGVVVITVCVDEERAAKVHGIELIITWGTIKRWLTFGCSLSWAVISQPLTNSNARITVDGLQKFFALVTDDPVGVDLGSSRGIERDHLEPAEVCFTDAKVLRANVVNIRHVIDVKVVLANVASPVSWTGEKRHKFSMCKFTLKVHIKWTKISASTLDSPSESSWSGLKASRQLSLSSGTPSLSSSWSQASPLPSLSWSTWLALEMYGQLSRLFWWPSSSMSWLLSHLSPMLSESESICDNTWIIAKPSPSGVHSCTLVS